MEIRDEKKTTIDNLMEDNIQILQNGFFFSFKLLVQKPRNYETVDRIKLRCQFITELSIYGSIESYSTIIINPSQYIILYYTDILYIYIIFISLNIHLNNRTCYTNMGEDESEVISANIDSRSIKIL